MAYPPAYTRTASFTDWETTHPGEPKPGVDLDTEFDNVANALTGTQNALALIQRSDGALANNSVGIDQLQDDLFEGIADDAVADAEAAAAAAAGSASAAAGSASAAASSAAAAATSAGTASGAASAAAISQGVAQTAATDAGTAADDAGDAADDAELAASTTAGSVAQAQLHEEMAFKWAEYLAAPVAPAPPGWPEAVDDGMFSSKWWALRARDFNSVHHIDLGTSGANIGAAFDQWDLTHDLPVGMIYATWGTPPHTYALTDPSNPSNPASWTDMTGGPGPAGPPNTLTIGSVVSGTPAAASITGTAPNQVLSLTIPPGATGATGATGPSGPAGAAGPPNTLSIGTVTTGTPGSAAGAAITGAAPNQTLSLTIPRGDVGPTGAAGAAGAAGATGPTGATGATGPANSLSIGSVTTGAPGSAAGATITGTAPTQVLSLTIPRGDVGATGAQGIQGIQGIQGPVGPTGPAGSSSFANPSGSIGLAAVNGVATTALRSDATHAIDQAIAPTWTGAHTFNGAVDLAGLLKASGAEGISGQVLASQGPGLATVWRTPGGGAIEILWNFSTAVGTANPGSQKMSLNSAVYTSVTTAVFNATAQTNFDANAILGLLQNGNRIYMQQRNDATKAVIYQVTGAATNAGGYWTVPVTHINSLGSVMFPANVDIVCVFIMSASTSTTFAAPTASVGLAAVSGSLSTAMRSDAAPALSQAIAPTWSAQHIFTAVGSGSGGAIRLVSATPFIDFNESDAGADGKDWDMGVNAGLFRWRLSNDAGTAKNIIAATRSSAALTVLDFGNATDNNTYNFLGTGLTTHNGPMVMGAPTGGSQGVGTINATGLFINGVAVTAGAGGTPGGSTTQIQYNNAGAFAGDPNFTWTNAGGVGVLTINTGSGFPTVKGADSSTATPPTMEFKGGNGTFAGSSGGTARLIGGTHSDGPGGSVQVTGGAGVGTTRNGGAVSLLGGAATGAAFGGAVSITGGACNAGAGTGGALTLTGGSSTFAGGAAGLLSLVGGSTNSIAAGVVSITGGAATASAGGAVNITGGTGNGTTGSSFGGNVTISGGPSNSTSAAGGGSVTIQGGTAVDGDGGQVTIRGFAGTTGRGGGDVVITSGANGTTGNAGNVRITAGGIATGTQGYIKFSTGTGAVDRLFINGNGSWGLAAAGTVGTSGQVLTSQGAAPPIWTTPTTVPASANPTATIGLTAVNGGSTPYMRADAAPALSQAISPNWSNGHTFSAILSTTGGPINLLHATSTGIYYSVTGQATDGKVWIDSFTTNFRQFTIENDAGSAAKNFMSFQRTLNVATAIAFGNAVDNTTYTFLGTSTVSAASFTTTSARASKRETGKPASVRDMLSKLRPLLYRLLGGDEREQLGLIAEEVHEVCPQLSDGKTVAYDRLAILLLAAWQEEHA